MNLKSALREKKVLIANHRGTFGGSIIENTLDAFRLAIKAGADVVELDIVRSTDGVYYVYHDTEEARTLGFANNLHKFRSDEIDGMRYVNRYGFRTSRKIDRFSDVLRALKGECFINLDRCAKYGFAYLKGALDEIAVLGMFDQVLVKTVPTEELLCGIAEYGAPVMYMPIVNRREQIERVLAQKLNTVALELLFASDGDALVSDEALAFYRAEDLALWANVICIDEQYVMAGGHTDNLALTESEQAGWGALIDRGFTILQTDWPYFLRQYLNRKVGRQ